MERESHTPWIHTFILQQSPVFVQTHLCLVSVRETFILYIPIFCKTLVRVSKLFV